MARIKHTHNSFNTGVISKDIQGNVGFEGYNNALSEAENFCVKATGGMFKRSGTIFVSETFAYGKGVPVLVPYKYSDTESCILEFGLLSATHNEYNPDEDPIKRKTGYLRVFTTNGIMYIQSYDGGIAITNMVAEDLVDLKYFQFGTTIYFLRKDGFCCLSRTSEKPLTFKWEKQIKYSVMPFSFLNKNPATMLRFYLPNEGADTTVNVQDGDTDKTVSKEILKKIGWYGTNVEVRFIDASEKHDNWYPSKDPGSPYDYKPGFQFGDSSASSIDGDRYISLQLQLSTSEPTEGVKFDNLSPMFFLKITKIEGDAKNSLFNKATGVLDKGLSPKTGKSNNECFIPSWSDTRMSEKNQGHYCDILFWRISAFNKDRGYPQACCVFDGRLFLANTKSEPLALWGSSTFYEDWFNFSLGQGEDGDAIQVRVNSQSADSVCWLVAHSKLFVGTSGGIWVCGSISLNDEPLSPRNFSAPRLFSNIGVSPLQPIQALDAVFFVDSSGTGVHEIVLNESSLFQVHNLSELSKDVTASGILDHAWQQYPMKMYWCVLGDGRLASLTYLKNNNIIAWSNHKIGGLSSKACSIAASQYKENDYVWMVVSRSGYDKNGNDVEIKTIEYIAPDTEGGSSPWEHHATDGGYHWYENYEITDYVNPIPAMWKFSDDKITIPAGDYSGFLAPIVCDFFGIVNDRKNLWFDNNVRPFTVVFKAFDGLYGAEKWMGEWYSDWYGFNPIVEVDHPNRYSMPSISDNTYNINDKNINTLFSNDCVSSVFGDGCAVFCRELVGVSVDSIFVDVDDKHYLKIPNISVSEKFPCNCIFVGSGLKNIDYDMSGKTPLNKYIDDYYCIIDRHPDMADVYSVSRIVNEVVTQIIFDNENFIPLNGNRVYVCVGPVIINRPYYGGICCLDSGSVLESSRKSRKNNRYGELIYIDGVKGQGMEGINNKYYTVVDGAEVNRKTIWYLANISNSIVIEKKVNYQGAEYLYENPLELYGTFEQGNKAFVFKTVRSLDLPSVFRYQYVDAWLDGSHMSAKLPVIETDGVKYVVNFETEFPCFAVSVGYPIKASFQTTPFFGGSPLGSSEGAIHSQKSATIRVYRSLGGMYGACKDKVMPIPYRLPNINTTEKIEPVSQIIKMPMSGLKSDSSYYDMTFYIEHNDPCPFAVLNVTREIEVSDA